MAKWQFENIRNITKIDKEVDGEIELLDKSPLKLFSSLWSRITND